MFTISKTIFERFKIVVIFEILYLKTVSFVISPCAVVMAHPLKNVGPGSILFGLELEAQIKFAIFYDPKSL